MHSLYVEHPINSICEPNFDDRKQAFPYHTTHMTLWSLRVRSHSILAL